MSNFDDFIRRVLSTRPIPYVGAGDAEVAVVLTAMRAGLRRKPLPPLGALDATTLHVVNAVYEEARNWSAGATEKVK